MLWIKRTGGTVFAIRGATKRAGPRTISNGQPRRDAAGNIDTDVQWRRVQFTYTVTVSREDCDNLWNLWKDSDPVITGATATNAFTFKDDEILTAWTACTLVDTEIDFGERLRGLQVGHTLVLTIECSASTYNTNRRTL